MFRYLMALGVVAALVTGSVRADDAKSDADTKVAEGTEVSLTAAEVKSDEKLDDGRPVAIAKAGKAAKVKMPAQAWTLGFTGEPVKGGGIKVNDMADATALVGMRTEAGGTEGPWQADPGDVITHANGYAVNSFEELLVAVSTAKKPEDVQLVVKDVNTGKPTIFYVTARKR
jgi:S1-C subfamily serine protease